MFCCWRHSRLSSPGALAASSTSLLFTACDLSRRASADLYAVDSRQLAAGSTVYTPTAFQQKSLQRLAPLRGIPPLVEGLFCLLPTACGRIFSAGLYFSARRHFCIYAVVLLGETLHKNYQVACDTFLYCVLRKFWEGVSCLCLVLLVYFLESIYLALCMFVRRGASALGTAKPAVLLFGVATPRAGP